MKTKVEINGYEINIEEVEGNITVTAQKDGETVEEFSLGADQQPTSGEDQEQSSVKGFSEFGEEEKDFTQEETVEDEVEDEVEGEEMVPFGEHEEEIYPEGPEGPEDTEEEVQPEGEDTEEEDTEEEEEVQPEGPEGTEDTEEEKEESALESFQSFINKKRK